MMDATSLALDFLDVRSESSQHKRKTDRLCCRCCAAATYTLLVEYIFTGCNLIVMNINPLSVLLYELRMMRLCMVLHDVQLLVHP